MTRNHTFFSYALVPKSTRSYFLTALWRHCIVENAMDQGNYDGREPGTPQVVGWAEVVEYLNPVFMVEVESGFMIVAPTPEVLGALVYAFEHLTQGVAFTEVIAKLDRLGKTFVHGFGTFDVS